MSLNALWPQIKWGVIEAVEGAKEPWPAIGLTASGGALAFLGVTTLVKDGVFDGSLSWLKGKKVCHIKPGETPKEKWQRTVRLAISSLMVGGGLFAAWKGASSLRWSSFQTTSRERALQEKLGSNILSFDGSDSRQKVLWLSAKESTDPQGAFGPERVVPFLEKLDASFDVKYQELPDSKSFCPAIKNAARRAGGPIDHLVVVGHGSPGTINLGDHFDALYTDKSLPTDCFEGLSKDARIVLMSCETGAKLDGVAAFLSRLSNRVVVAPRSKIAIEATSIFQSTSGKVGVAMVDFSRSEQPVSTERYFCSDGTHFDGSEKNYGDLRLSGISLPFWGPIKKIKGCNPFN